MARLAGLAVVAIIGLTVLPASAGAQEASTPEPTSQTPSPSPSPSPEPAPVLPPPPPAPTVQEPARERPRPYARPRRPPRRERQRERQKEGRRQQRPKRRPVRIRTGCAPFAFTQTYGAWGPALAYGDTVTVAYEASRCTRRSGTAAALTLQGTAAVYRGAAAEGKPIEVRPFSATGMWDRPTNPSGWPPEWWACDVKNARYTWVIEGIYSFRVVARWGVWTLSVDTQGAQQGVVHWAYNGCG